MDRTYILSEIKRTAEENGGVPLGESRFRALTGVSKSDWYGRFWRNWGDAVTEAGYRPNEFQAAFADEAVFAKLAEFVREIGRYPVKAELMIRARADPSFPSFSVFERIGNKNQRTQQFVAYCREVGGLEDVVAICEALSEGELTRSRTSKPQEPEFGIVYLYKAGRFYKIGRSNSGGRREYELSIQLPERGSLVHEVRTDDPAGIEEYWHKRFAAKRKNGEWFDLSAADVTAFKRRTFR